MLSNLQSGSNIGSICRNSLAFGVTEVIVVGRKDFFGKMRGADRGAKFKQRFSQFPSTEDAVLHLRTIEQSCRILGVEITDDSVSIHEQPFTGPTMFVFGNEGAGLSERQRSICDGFIYIPQFSAATAGAGGMASINVACASALVLYTYAQWAGLKESTRHGEKFQ